MKLVEIKDQSVIKYELNTDVKISAFFSEEIGRILNTKAQ